MNFLLPLRRSCKELPWMLACSCLFLCHPLAHADTNITDCTDSPDLRAALSAGGVVTFDCDGPITLTDSITITKDTILIGSENSTMFSGDNAFRLFNVNTGVTFTVLNLTLSDGFSTNGGAIYNRGTLVASNCAFTGN